MKLSLFLGACGIGLMAGCGGAEPSPDVDPTEDPAAASEQDLVASKVTITTNPSPVVVGAVTSLDVRVRTGQGAPITQFDPLHTQPMHLIAVSSDLEDFIHVHPALQAAGNLTTSATFSRSEPYALFMEYDPAGAAGPTLSRARVAPAGSHVVAAQLDPADAFGGSTSKTVIAGGTAIELVGSPGGMIMANTNAHLVFRFRNTNGSPVTNLTNWLGMPAHGIVVSPDLKTFLHEHGMAESATGGGHGGHGMAATTSTGPIGIDVSLPKAGLYKIFLQFQRGTTLITAPFVLQVMASHGTPPPPPQTCATTTCPHGQMCMVMGGGPMCM